MKVGEWRALTIRAELEDGCTEDDIDDEDGKILGDHNIEILSSGDDGQDAGRALDKFHKNVAVAHLDLFVFSVLDGGRKLVEDDDYEEYSYNEVRTVIDPQWTIALKPCPCCKNELLWAGHESSSSMSIECHPSTDPNLLAEGVGGGCGLKMVVQIEEGWDKARVRGALARMKEAEKLALEFAAERWNKRA
jgi:hypothetical protein